VMQGGPNAAAGVREGDILDGKYRVERVLGIGGMGVVVAAHHIRLNEKVALKVLLPEALGNADAVARFAREAQAAVKIKSEYVARVTDVGTLPNGAPYMVMEYLEGGDLAEWIKQRGALPIEQAVEFVLHACIAVADAHALKIIHRDLKPANLFCVRRSDGQLSIKVLDFGISKMTDAAGAGAGVAMTRTSAMMGTPLYMSPEQMRSAKDVGAQTDIWALGAILFELMAGRPAFLAESVTELAIKVNNEPPPSVRTFRPDVPAGLEAIIFKCLEKDPRQRYANVAVLALALLPFAPKRAKASVERISGIIQAAGLSASALELPPSPPVSPGTLASGAPGLAPSTTPGVSHTTPGSTGTPRRTGVIIGGAAISFAAVLGALLVLRKAPTPPPITERAVATPASSPASAGPPGVTTATAVPTAAATTAASPAQPAPATSATPTHPSRGPQSPASSPTPTVTSAVRPPPQSGPVAAAATQQSSPVSEPPRQPAMVKPTAPDCSIPFTIDSRGHHVPKPECM
jgi:eukaryotic-like serine/threonine-protein kinase